MAETVKAVTGLNLEYSRFTLPSGNTYVASKTIFDPDCNCASAEETYQFPGNWDTGPDALDVSFYPRSYSGSKLPLFNPFQMLTSPNVSVTSNYCSNSLQTSASYIDGPVSVSLTAITLTKTEDVFKDHPNIPKKCIQGSINRNSSHFVSKTTHWYISRKCWAGKGMLGSDEVLIIYSPFQLIICYLGSNGSSYIPSQDEASGPHSVIIGLNTGTGFGLKSSFETTEGYGYNDSYQYYYSMGTSVYYYVFNPYLMGSAANFLGTYYYAYNFFGVSDFNFWSSPPNDVFSYMYNPYEFKKMTGAVVDIKAQPLAGTSVWMCTSGRPLKVNYRGGVVIPTQTFNPPAPLYEDFGTGIDSWEYLGIGPFYSLDAIPPVPELLYNIPICYQIYQQSRQGQMLGYAGDTHDFTKVVVPFANGLYDLRSLRVSGGGTGYWQNPYFWFYYYGGIEYPDCSNNQYDYGGYGGGLSFGSYGVAVPAFGETFYTLGTPVNQRTLGDGSLYYETLDLVTSFEASSSIPRLVEDIPLKIAIWSQPANDCWNPCYGGYGYDFMTPWMVYDTVQQKLHKIIYKLTRHNIPASTGGFVVPQAPEDPTGPQDFLNMILTPGVVFAEFHSGSLVVDTAKETPTGYFGSPYGKVTYAHKFITYPAGVELSVPICNSTVTNEASKIQVLQYPAPYVPFILSSIRPTSGLKYPAKLTDPKVRIYTTEEIDPEESRPSNFSKYFFSEFDPSNLIKAPEKVLTSPMPPINGVAQPPLKLVLPNFKAASLIPTGLPRATNIYQTVVEQSEVPQCVYKRAELSDNYYYFTPGLYSSLTVDLRNKFYPEIPAELEPEVCTDNYFLGGMWIGNFGYTGANCYLFDESRGAEQYRSSGTLDEWYQYRYGYYNGHSSIYNNYAAYNEVITHPQLLLKWYEEQDKAFSEVQVSTCLHYINSYVYLQPETAMIWTNGLCYPGAVTTINNPLAVNHCLTTEETCGHPVNTNISVRLDANHQLKTPWELALADDALAQTYHSAYLSAMMDSGFTSRPPARVRNWFVTGHTKVSTGNGGYNCIQNDQTRYFTLGSSQEVGTVLGGGIFYSARTFEKTLPGYGAVRGKVAILSYWYQDFEVEQVVGVKPSVFDCPLLVTKPAVSSLKTTLTGPINGYGWSSQNTLKTALISGPTYQLIIQKGTSTETCASSDFPGAMTCYKSGITHIENWYQDYSYNTAWGLPCSNCTSYYIQEPLDGIVMPNDTCTSVELLPIVFIENLYRYYT